MNTKLTLSIKKEVIEDAKAFAKQTGRSLSDIIENYLQSITKTKHQEVSSKLKRLIGSVSLPENFDEENEKNKNLSAKHQ